MLLQAVRASLGVEPLVPVPANANGTVAEVDLPAHPAPNMGMPAVEPEPCVTTVDTAGLPAPHHKISSHPVGCFSHPVGCFSHPVGCFCHPILDWEEDDEWDIPHPDGDTPTTNAGKAGPITGAYPHFFACHTCCVCLSLATPVLSKTQMISSDVSLSLLYPMPSALRLFADVEGSCRVMWSSCLCNFDNPQQPPCLH